MLSNVEAYPSNSVYKVGCVVTIDGVNYHPGDELAANSPVRNDPNKIAILIRQRILVPGSGTVQKIETENGSATVTVVEKKKRGRPRK